MTGVDEKPKGEQCTAVSTQLAPGEPPCELPAGHLGAHYNGYARWGHKPMGVLPTQADLAAAPGHVGVQPNSPLALLRRDVNKLIGLVPGNVWNNGGALSSQWVTAQLRERVEQLERAMVRHSDTEVKPDEEPAEWVINGLRRKVRVQANEINKLTELRKGTVEKTPEYANLMGELDTARRSLATQAGLTEREHRMRLDDQQRLGKALGRITSLEDELVDASRETARLDEALIEKHKRLIALTRELAKPRTELADALSKNANLAAANQDLRSTRAQDTAKISELADAEAAAGWREQCEATHRPECAVWLDRCQRAAGHTGTHSSDARAGKGREWVV
jgi:hypothetical protein